MSKIPLLKAKLVVPEIPNMVLFSARIKSLNISEHRAVIITAPAGFGKTTAVLLSLRNERAQMRWYRLEKEDSFLPVFYAHLIETLFAQEDQALIDSTRSLASINKISEEYPLLNAVICQDAWARYSDSKDQIYIIFDDFQNVVANKVIVETIKYLISNMPPNFRVIVMSRIASDIQSGKLALNGDILQLDEQALRFSKEDVAKLTSEIYKINIPFDDIYTLHEYSEGWIAGITMLIHAAGSSLLNLKQLLTQNGDNKEQLFSYFLSEAFSGSDKDMIKTLASISILADFTSDDLKAVFKMENATEIMAWLEKNNIYIQKVKAKVTTYRLHSLFRSALLSIINELFTPSEITIMNLNAAYHYKNLGDFNSAIRFLIAAGRTNEAVNIASVEGVRITDTGDTDRVTSLVQEFPEELIQNNEHLLFLRGASLMSTELDQSYSYLNLSLLLALQSGNLNLQMRAVVFMISICIQNNDHKKIAEIIILLPKCKMLVMSRYARISLLICAFMKTAWADDLASARILSKLIDRFSFHEPLWDHSYKAMRGIIFYRTGDFPAAEAILNQILNHPTTLINDRWRTFALVIGHAITSLMGDVEASQKLSEELALIGEKYNSDYANSYSFRLTAITKYQTRDIISAVAKMEESEKAFARYNNPMMVCATRITKYLWQAEYEAAEPLAAKAAVELNHLEVLRPGLGMLELCQAQAGALFKEAGNYPEAERLLIKAYKASKGKKTLQYECGAALHLADLYYRKNELKLEEKYLRILGKIVASKGYVYFSMMNYPTLVRVCARCIEKKISPDYMLRIIGKYFNNDNAARIAKTPTKAVADPKSFITSCSTPQQKAKAIRIKLFGSFKMAVDNLEIGEKEWKTRKICGILKFILANPEKTVSRDVLATTFWPDSDSKAAFTSLRVALYELRKILTRFGIAFESEDALITESKDGFYLSNPNTIESDADKFNRLNKNHKSGNLSREETKAMLSQMIELYQGDFLENDSYDEWVALTREHYKSVFIEVSLQLAGLYIDDEKEQAEALLKRHMKVDPLDEKACGMLIYLYNSTSRKNQAASLRRQFEKRFEAEMGVKPDLALEKNI